MAHLETVQAQLADLADFATGGAKAAPHKDGLAAAAAAAAGEEEPKGEPKGEPITSAVSRYGLTWEKRFDVFVRGFIREFEPYQE